MTSIHIATHDLQVVYEADQIENLYQTLDELHSAVSDGELNQITTLSESELADLLRDIVFTAQETLKELAKRQTAKSQTKRPAPILQFVPAERVETRNA